MCSRSFGWRGWLKEGFCRRCGPIQVPGLYWKSCDFSTSQHHPRSCLHLSDHCCFAAKRQGGGSGGSFWRDGLTDGVRSARISDAAFEGDDHFGNHLYGDFDVALDRGDAGNGQCRPCAGAPRRCDEVRAGGPCEDSNTCARNTSTARADEVVLNTPQTCGGGGIGRRTSLRC